LAAWQSEPKKAALNRVGFPTKARGMPVRLRAAGRAKQKHKWRPIDAAPQSLALDRFLVDNIERSIEGAGGLFNGSSSKMKGTFSILAITLSSAPGRIFLSGYGGIPLKSNCARAERRKIVARGATHLPGGW
jgi:hypothetical protein